MIVISKPMTDPFMCCYIWCSMDPINIPPLCLFAYIQAHHGSVMGNAWHGTHAPISGHRNLVTVDIYRKPMVLQKLPYFHDLFSIQDIMSLYIYNILTCWKAPPFFVDLCTHTSAWFLGGMRMNSPTTLLPVSGPCFYPGKPGRAIGKMIYMELFSHVFCTRWCPSSYKLVQKTIVTIDISTIDHSQASYKSSEST